MNESHCGSQSQESFTVLIRLQTHCMMDILSLIRLLSSSLTEDKNIVTAKRGPDSNLLKYLTTSIRFWKIEITSASGLWQFAYKVKHCTKIAF